MRIVYTAEGGLASFPGLQQPTLIDSRDLPPAEAAELGRLLDAAHFFELPEDCRALHPGAADYQQYAISVEHAHRRHTVRLADPVANPQLRALLDLLQRYAKRPAKPVSVV
jgi:hypothetical protein